MLDMDDPLGDGAIVSHVRYMSRLGRRPRTIEARRDALKRFRQWTGNPLLNNEREDVEDYIDHAHAPATKRVYLAHLRSFYGWALDDGLVGTDPTRKVVGPALPRQLPHPISEADLALALHTAPPLIRAWLMLASFAGLRACEIGPICGEHIIRQGEHPYLVIPEGKGGRSRTVPLADVLMAELDRWPTTGWMWKPDGPYHHAVISRKVSHHLQGLGIHATLHSCRHRFGTQSYIASGRDIRLTQELLGHASPATTAIYTALDPAEGSSVVSRLPVLS